MAVHSVELESARKHYEERLAILKRSLSLYRKNKHRSIPNRGPYEYALKVAKAEFESARLILHNTMKMPQPDPDQSFTQAM